MNKAYFARITLLECFIWFLLAFLPVFFTVNYLTHTTMLDSADPSMLAHFQGHKPFQLRILAPLFLAGLEKVGVEIGFGLQIIAFTSALAFAGAFYLYLNEFLSSKTARWASLFAWVPLSLFYTHFSFYFGDDTQYWFYIYDLPSVFFLTLGLLLLQRQKWVLFGFLLFVASLNRESSLLLVLCYGATHGSLRDRTFWLRFLTYSAICIVVKVTLSLIFAYSPGPGIEWHLSENLMFLLNPAQWKSGFIVNLEVLTWVFGAALWKWRFCRVYSRFRLVLAQYIFFCFAWLVLFLKRGYMAN